MAETDWHELDVLHRNSWNCQNMQSKSIQKVGSTRGYIMSQHVFKLSNHPTLSAWVKRCRWGPLWTVSPQFWVASWIDLGEANWVRAVDDNGAILGLLLKKKRPQPFPKKNMELIKSWKPMAFKLTPPKFKSALGLKGFHVTSFRISENTSMWKTKEPTGQMKSCVVNPSKNWTHLGCNKHI